MRKNKQRFAIRASVAAVHGALVAIAAMSAAQAADDNAKLLELTKPTNFFEVGAGYVSESSAKFGQYNGLFNQGAYGIFNFDWRGGASYDLDSDSAVRWRLLGTDLGLDTRAAYAEYGQQGTFRVFAGFDELRSNYTDTYQTPYLGVGSNTLTLPKNWVKPIVPQVSTTAGNFRALSPTTGLGSAIVNGVVTPPTAAQQATVNNIIANDVPDFGNQNLETTRKTYSGGFSYNFGPRWQLLVSASTMDQNGLKALGMINLASGTASTINPNLIDTTTNQYNASLTYMGEQFFFTAAYYGSYFNNHVSSMTWENPFVPGTFATMSSAPSNDFNQFILKGGYNFTPTTKLVMGASYARATQNDSYIAYTGAPLGYPVSSPDALVVSTQFNAKLTAKPVKDLNVALGYKYNNRDNKTSVNTYVFYDANEPPTTTPSPFNAALGLAPGTLASNINIYANRPYSKKQNQVNADADYVVSPGQSLKAGYEWQQIDRSCPGSWINCADAPKATTNTLGLAWDANSLENVTGRLSYAYSQRRVDYDENGWLALVPMANVVPAGVGATTSVVNFLTQTGLGGFGPIAPYVPLQPGNLGVFFPNNSALPQNLYGSRNDIHEIPGMRRFNMADRNQNRVRGTINWDATERFSLTGNVEYNQDDYSNSVYGLKNAKNLAVTLEGSFAVTPDFNTNAFYTYEEQKLSTAGASYASGAITNTATVNGVAGNTVVSGGCFSTVIDKNMNAKVDPCLNWATDMQDKINTFGASFKYTGLMAGKLELWGDLIYSKARTTINVTGGQYANSPFAVAGKPAVVPAAFFIPATNLPDVESTLFGVRIAGQYWIDKASAVRLAYWYQHLSSNDYAYDGMQYGTITSVMPTNQQTPSYNVSVVGLSYVYQWR